MGTSSFIGAPNPDKSTAIGVDLSPHIAVISHCSDTQPGGWFSLAIAMQIKKSCGRMAVSWFLFLPPNKQACSILQHDIAIVRHEPRSTLTWRRLSVDRHLLPTSASIHLILNIVARTVLRGLLGRKVDSRPISTLARSSSL
jgi:hypothetical protein